MIQTWVLNNNFLTFHYSNAELSMGWVDPRVVLGWAGLGRDFLAFWWVGLGRGSETFLKILKRVSAEVIPDNLIMINTNKLSPAVIYYNCLPCVRRFVIGCMDFD